MFLGNQLGNFNHSLLGVCYSILESCFNDVKAHVKAESN